MSDLFDIDWLGKAKHNPLYWGWILSTEEYANDFDALNNNVQPPEPPEPPEPPKIPPPLPKLSWRAEIDKLHKLKMPARAIVNNIDLKYPQVDRNAIGTYINSISETKLDEFLPENESKEPENEVGNTTAETNPVANKSDPLGNVLRDIQTGKKTFKKIDPEIEKSGADHKKRKEVQKNILERQAQNNDPRAKLLMAIEKGTKLQTAKKRKLKPKPKPTNTKPTMQDALSNRLAKVRVNTNPDSDADSDADNTDWEA